ncbi:MAG: Thymidine phosphorylase [Thermotoga sp. 50_1627]|uniref:thymidine phosphorylase n=1 Tax=Pseudothermotoga sp. TaxID=2033661 RepID=UPI00076DB5A1|nr:MAG: Thymidine phosphorylase [Thermotoga sp. 50_64]KUK25956.1 MAG: Thymidine phosphorylase [Thermotoga sp. 50_1627]MBC7116061.1 thymidine phosphorylase [Pseudothermotoga sp.]MDK2923438.1 pyrimidine-nucleoside phosphorylase [Pseudothermotoga sp.]HBT38619.1 thymidine phosphorylase [Pseudothermotoga sp.]
MRMYDIIKKKRDGEELTAEEIRFVVHGYTSGEIPDYQMAAFLMAVYFRGMNERETYDLTIAMLESGERLDLSSLKGTKLDKHSSGGVGDKITFVVLPIAASFGVKIVKMSGRGLGHTGGTIDKLESIPGMRTSLTKDEFIKIVDEIGFAVASQTENLAPADKKIYALRDATATVENFSLIASSIVSKKLAAGADAIVFDVKVGSGAFMKDVDQARRLALLMLDIVKRNGKKARAVLSGMDQPLGRMVGNSLELVEALECLRGEGPEDVMELSFTLVKEMLDLAGVRVSYNDIEGMVRSHEPLNRFKKFIERQGGDPSVVDDLSRLPISKDIVEVRADRDGYVTRLNAEAIGRACVLLGGGRSKKEDEIDHSVGIELLKKVSDRVKSGDVLAKVYHSKRSDLDSALDLVQSAYVISERSVELPPIVLEVIR